SISWATPVDGSWNDGSNWSSGTVPGAADDVAIAGDTAFTVTIASIVFLNSLDLSGQAKLVIGTNGSLTLNDIFTSDGAISNGGSLEVKSGGIANGMVVSAGGVETVDSGGTIGSTTIDGGIVDLLSGANTTGPFTFTGTGGVLRIDDGPGYRVIDGGPGI